MITHIVWKISYVKLVRRETCEVKQYKSNLYVRIFGLNYVLFYTNMRRARNFVLKILYYYITLIIATQKLSRLIFVIGCIKHMIIIILWATTLVYHLDFIYYYSGLILIYFDVRKGNSYSSKIRCSEGAWSAIYPAEKPDRYLDKWTWERDAAIARSRCSRSRNALSTLQSLFVILE